MPQHRQVGQLWKLKGCAAVHCDLLNGNSIIVAPQRESVRGNNSKVQSFTLERATEAEKGCQLLPHIVLFASCAVESTVRISDKNVSLQEDPV